MSKDISDVCATMDRDSVKPHIESRFRPVQIKNRIVEVPEPQKLPPIVTASDLILHKPKPPGALIHGLLHKGSVMVLGGASKSNKTFCLMDMALSVAAGQPWWDLKTTQGRVLYIDYELQPYFLANRLHVIQQYKCLDEKVFEDVDVLGLRGHAANLTDQVDAILAQVNTQAYSLIIVDPIYKALGDRDENAAGDINSLMNEVDKIAVETKAAVVIGHHFSKGNQSGKESIDRVSGSGVFGRSPDSLLMLTKHEQDGVFVVETNLRNFKPMPAFCVEFEYPVMIRKADADPTKLKTAGAAKTKYTPEMVLNVLGEQQLTTGEWKKLAMKELGISDGTFGAKKAILVDQKKVTADVDGKWRVTKTPPKEATPIPANPVQNANDAIALPAAA